jgi:hypothetical protein
VSRQPPGDRGLAFEDDRLGLLVFAKAEVARVAKRALAGHFGKGDLGNELRLDPVRAARLASRRLHRGFLLFERPHQRLEAQ